MLTLEKILRALEQISNSKEASSREQALEQLNDSLIHFMRNVEQAYQLMPRSLNKQISGLFNRREKHLKPIIKKILLKCELEESQIHLLADTLPKIITDCNSRSYVAAILLANVAAILINNPLIAEFDESSHAIAKEFRKKDFNKVEIDNHKITEQVYNALISRKEYPFQLSRKELNNPKNDYIAKYRNVQKGHRDSLIISRKAGDKPPIKQLIDDVARGLWINHENLAKKYKIINDNDIKDNKKKLLIELINDLKKRINSKAYFSVLKEHYTQCLSYLISQPFANKFLSSPYLITEPEFHQELSQNDTDQAYYFEAYADRYPIKFPDSGIKWQFKAKVKVVACLRSYGFEILTIGTDSPLLFYALREKSENYDTIFDKMISTIESIETIEGIEELLRNISSIKSKEVVLTELQKRQIVSYVNKFKIREITLQGLLACIKKEISDTSELFISIMNVFKEIEEINSLLAEKNEAPISDLNYPASSSLSSKLPFSAAEEKKAERSEATLKILLEHVVRGEQKEANEIISQNPKLLLESGMVEDYSFGLNPENHRKIKGTALQIALGAEDVEMCEMIVPYFNILPDGEAEKLEQINAQFPEGYEEQEKARNERDLAALNKVVQTIANAVDDDDDSGSDCEDDCEAELSEFRNYLEPRDAITTGKHFNSQLLLRAFELYDENYMRFGGSEDSPKNILFWQKVIGYIQRFLPSCYAQAFTQGLYYIIDEGEKLNRSFQFNKDNASFFPLDSDLSYRLGFDWAVTRWSGGRCAHRHGGKEVASALTCFSKLSSRKDLNITRYLTLTKVLSQLPLASHEEEKNIQPFSSILTSIQCENQSSVNLEITKQQMEKNIKDLNLMQKTNEVLSHKCEQLHTELQEECKTSQALKAQLDSQKREMSELVIRCSQIQQEISMLLLSPEEKHETKSDLNPSHSSLGTCSLFFSDNPEDKKIEPSEARIKFKSCG